MNDINENIELVKNMVKRFYDKGKQKKDRRDAEEEIEDYLDKHIEKSREKVADDICDRCKFIMKYKNYPFEESWNIIESLLTEPEEGFLNQIKDSVLMFSKTGRPSDLYEVEERSRDYLKHIVDLDEIVETGALRRTLVDDISKILKTEKRNRSDFEQMWAKVQDKIDLAWSLSSDDIGDPKKMDDDELRSTFVPRVYQKDINSIDYDKLKDAGVKLITFDIDATLGLPGMWKAPSGTKSLFIRLHNMGFQTAIFSNAPKDRVEAVKEELGAFSNLGHGGKPHTFGFNYFVQEYVSKGIGPELKYEQIAHVGNDITKDIRAGNKAGVITCMVRNFGGTFGCSKILYPDAHRVTKLLEKRGIWRKHHRDRPDDQYYQYGEEQK
ncbi:MAG: hypothetical protein IKH71_00155 [Oscillospiraceae bacterium]|nr:hypothetical protein [Oscillospiraceae bacterium]